MLVGLQGVWRNSGHRPGHRAYAGIPQPSQRICGGYSWQRRGGSDGIFTHPHCRLSGKRSDSYPGSVSGGFHGKKAEKNYAQCPGSDYDSLSGDAWNISGGDAGNRPRHACGGA